MHIPPFATQGLLAIALSAFVSPVYARWSIQTTVSSSPVRCRDANVSQCEMNSHKLSKRYISIKDKARVEPKAKTDYHQDSGMKVYYLALHIKILKENSEASSKSQGQDSTSTSPNSDLIYVCIYITLLHSSKNH